MDRSLHFGFKNRLQFRTIFKVVIIIAVAFWSWPVVAGPPNSGKDDDATKKRNNNANWSGPQNNQSGRVSHHDITPQSGPAVSRATSTPAPVVRSSNINNGGQTNHFRRDTQPSPINQSKAAIPSIRSDSLRSIARDVSTPVIKPARPAGNVSNSQTPQISAQRITPKLDAKPRIIPVGEDVQRNNIDRTTAADVRRQLGTPVIKDNTNLRGHAPANIETATNPKLGIPKFELAADNTKSTDKSNDNTDQRPVRQDIRKQVQGPIQSNNAAGSGQTNQNTRIGGAAGGQIITPAPGGRFTTPPPAGTIDRSTLPDARQRLRDNTLGKGQTNLNTGAAGNQSTTTTLGAGEKTGISDARQRLQDKGQLDKKLDTNIKTNNTLGGVTNDKLNTAGPNITGPALTDKKTDLHLESPSGSHSSIPEVRNRLNEKGGLPGTSGDKSNITDSKHDTAIGTPKNLLDTNSTERGKQHTGLDDKVGKHGPPDLNLGNKTETLDLKHKDGQSCPGLTTKQFPHNPPQIGETKISREDMLKSRFPDRLKSGELDKVTKGDIAQKVKLSDQYQMMQKGDVARRMDLNKHAKGVVDVKNIHINNNNHINVTALRNVNDYYVARPYYYHGMVNPAYVNNCFRFAYYGPSFFAGACWYPHWNPWVAWSWGYHCHPIWDPRPIWCRPVIYDPYYNWVYWQPPVWVTLPETPSGTWVDVQKPVVPEAQTDLQLLAVRFVDPGHPDEKLGPRYRVWFRNNSAEPIEKPFNVMLFAGNDDKLTADLPRSGVRVKAIEAGDIQSVDIRLPMEATTMWHDADGNPAPFQVLQAMVDANREIVDATRTNNGAAISRDEVLSIDPAAFEADPTKLTAGSEMILAGEGLGPQPGQVLVSVGGKELQAEVLGWYDLGVRINVPRLELSEPTQAEVVVVRGDGAATNPVKVTLLPGEVGPTLTPPPPAPAE
jgi:hypothetical protein